jgi:hypothetical protein
MEALQDIYEKWPRRGNYGRTKLKVWWLGQDGFAAQGVFPALSDFRMGKWSSEADDKDMIQASFKLYILFKNSYGWRGRRRALHQRGGVKVN